jgi:pimeloyl-ACP methyl ester carboxylesterase
MAGAAPTLLLLHGLGATPGVWDDLVDTLDWDGPVLRPALPGHASAPWTGEYTIPALARAMASGVPTTGHPLIAGHSLGGAVGIELASGRYGLSVVGVLGLGIKTTWTDDDVAGMAKVAERGVRWFPTRAEAVTRFLRLAGLDAAAPVVDTDHEAAGAASRGALVDAVVEGAGPDAGRGWRVAQDPATFAQRPVDMPTLLAAARCPVWIGAGEHDAMATESELSAFTDSPHIAAGRGHNVQVEDPAWTAALIEQIAAAVSHQG